MNFFTKEMRQLIDQLNEASKLYYNGGNSPLTDSEFDNMLAKLQKLEKETHTVFFDSPTMNVGAGVLSEISKVTISDRPMLSLKKVYSAEDIFDFADFSDLIASVKCDGVSVRLIYEDGVLVAANTRGDGMEGGDITAHVRYFTNVPATIDKEGRYVVDGEAVILQKDFESLDKETFKNPRNTVAGSLSLLDLSLVKERKISFILWDVIVGGSSRCVDELLEEAEELGFDVVPRQVSENYNDIYDISEFNKEMLAAAKEKGIPCDGVVWRIIDNDEGDSRGKTAHHFLNAVAWKPKAEEYDTELKHIDWSVGRTGVLTPVAVFRPVVIDGTVVERASLHNITVMRDTLGECAYVGEPLKVAKMNMIIPQVTSAGPHKTFGEVQLEKLTPANDTLDCCPYCQSVRKPLNIVQSETGVDNYICSDPQCSGRKVNHIVHFFSRKGVTVQGIGPTLVESLMGYGWVNSIPDMLRLEQRRTEWEKKPGFGAVSVNVILTRLRLDTAEVALDRFISGIGIPFMGLTNSLKLCAQVKDWKDFRQKVMSNFDWSQFDSIGTKLTQYINNFDYTEADELARMLYFKPNVLYLQTNNPATAKKKFCITGTFPIARRDLVLQIEQNGGTWTEAISKSTDYLICNDPKTEISSKAKKARQYGIPLISWTDALWLLDQDKK